MTTIHLTHYSEHPEHIWWEHWMPEEEDIDLCEHLTAPDYHPDKDDRAAYDFIDLLIALATAHGWTVEIKEA